jgi:hypothetical protein
MFLALLEDDEIRPSDDSLHPMVKMKPNIAKAF